MFHFHIFLTPDSFFSKLSDVVNLIENDRKQYHCKIKTIEGFNVISQVFLSLSYFRCDYTIMRLRSASLSVIHFQAELAKG